MTLLTRPVAMPVQEATPPLSLFDLSPAPLWVHDEETSRIIAVSDGLIERCGYTRQEFLAMTLEELWFGEALSPREAAGREALRCGRLRQAGGAFVAVELVSRPVEIDGRSACLIAVREIESEARLRQALAESRRDEQRLRRLSEAASDWFWEADAKGRLTYLSAKYETVYGRPVAALLGQRLEDMPGVSIAPSVAETVRAAIKARAPSYAFTYSVRPPAVAKVLWVHTNCKPVFDADGALQGFCGASRDITAQVEAEQALRDSEQRFRRLFEIGADYYWEQDENYRSTFVSPQSVHEKIFGIPFSQYRGKLPVEVSAMKFDAETGARVVAAARAHEPYRDVVFSVTHGSGEVRWVSVSAAPRFDETGKFIGFHGIGTDITARKEAEARAQLAQGRLHDAVACVTQPFVVYDDEDRAGAFNQAFIELFRNPIPPYSPVCTGLAFRDLAEWQIETGFYATGPEEEAVDLDSLLAHYHSEREHTFHLHDGRWMLVIHRPLPDGGRVGLWTDITATVNAQIEADRANKAKSIFLATISHEIRTPLNGVLGMARAMRFDALSPAQRRRLDVVERSGEALLALLNDVLDISKIEAGKVELERIDFDLSAVIRSAHEAFLAITAEKGLATALDIAAGDGIFHGDPMRVRQILSNLLSNAVKFTERGRIEIKALRTETGIRIVVSDTGIGMSAETAARMFEKFSQADASTTRRFGGTGLGLAICRELAGLMGGSIAVDSVLGRGSNFIVDLPLPYIGPVPPPAETLDADPAEILAGRNSPLRILVAEDNLINQRVLRAFLNVMGELDLQMVTNGAQAIDAWEARDWDLIFMDVNMPVMDGITAARQIRAREYETRRPRTPIIALTANAMAHHTDEYLAAGMDSHVAKPVEPNALFAALTMAKAESPKPLAEARPRKG
jgi:PAS domain S-box-containing protein